MTYDRLEEVLPTLRQILLRDSEHSGNGGSGGRGGRGVILLPETAGAGALPGAFLEGIVLLVGRMLVPIPVHNLSSNVIAVTDIINVS